MDWLAGFRNVVDHTFASVLVGWDLDLAVGYNEDLLCDQAVTEMDKAGCSGATCIACDCYRVMWFRILVRQVGY